MGVDVITLVGASVEVGNAADGNEVASKGIPDTLVAPCPPSDAHPASRASPPSNPTTSFRMEFRVRIFILKWSYLFIDLKIVTAVEVVQLLKCPADPPYLGVPESTDPIYRGIVPNCYVQRVSIGFRHSQYTDWVHRGFPQNPVLSGQLAFPF